MSMLPTLGVVSKRPDGRVRVVHGFKRDDKKYAAMQQFKDECDINQIMAKVRRKQVHLQDLIREDGKYGDYSTAGDFMSAQNIIAHAKEQFEALPARTRDRFNNDPVKLLEFIQDGDNVEEARKLGMLKPKAPDTVPGENKDIKPATSKKSAAAKPKGAAVPPEEGPTS